MFLGRILAQALTLAPLQNNQSRCRKEENEIFRLHIIENAVCSNRTVVRGGRTDPTVAVSVNRCSAGPQLHVGVALVAELVRSQYLDVDKVL